MSSSHESSGIVLPPRLRSGSATLANLLDRNALPLYGLIIAAFVSIPIVNLATPMFGMAFMVHMHKRLSGPRPELIEPSRRREMSMR